MELFIGIYDVDMCVLFIYVLLWNIYCDKFCCVEEKV